MDVADAFGGLCFMTTAFQMNNAPGYQAATTSLSAEQQTLLMEVMRIAQQNEVNAAGPAVDQA